MSEHRESAEAPWRGEVAPGDERQSTELSAGIRGYLIGFVLAALLTAASFALITSPLVAGLIWGPGIPVALGVLAVAQMGVHLTFFLHIGTGPDNTNNVMALAFGVLIVGMVIAGSLWIMFHLNANMMPAMETLTDLHRQR